MKVETKEIVLDQCLRYKQETTPKILKGIPKYQGKNIDLSRCTHSLYVSPAHREAIALRSLLTEQQNLLYVNNTSSKSHCLLSQKDSNPGCAEAETIRRCLLKLRLGRVCPAIAYLRCATRKRCLQIKASPASAFGAALCASP